MRGNQQVVVREILASRARRTGAVLDQVAAFIERFMVMTPEQTTVATLWAALSHSFQAFHSVPYLLITSPAPEAGKSVLLEVLEGLVRNPLRVVSPTPAAVFRALGAEPRTTLLVDEMDALAQSRELRAIVDSGYRQGGYVPRVGPLGLPVRFPTFGMKAFAGLSGRRLPLAATTRGRCVAIELRKKLPSEHVEWFLPRREEAEAERLREALAGFAARHYRHFEADEPPDLPDVLDGRGAEIWWPLTAIADAAGGAWPHLTREAAITLTARRQSTYDDGLALLSDIRTVLRDHAAPRIATAALLLGLAALDDPAYAGSYAALGAQGLARRLRPFGVSPRVLKIEGRALRGYEVAQFQDPFARYLPEEPQPA